MKTICAKNFLSLFAQIRAAEDVQTLIRQLQEMWLFGQLDTLGHSHAQQRTDEDAKAVAQLLQQLMEREQQQQQPTKSPREPNADAVMADANEVEEEGN